MTKDRDPNDRDLVLDPEDVNSAPTDESLEASDSDPGDEVPVPVAMSPAEVDERAQAVEALRSTLRSGPVEGRNGDV